MDKPRKKSSGRPPTEGPLYHSSPVSAGGETVTPEVLEQLRQGNHDAFEQLYVRYERPLFHFIKTLTGSYDQAEELLQEIFVNIWTHHDRIDPAKNIRNYLYVAAKNATLNYIYSRNKKKTDIQAEDFEEQLSDDISVEDAMVAKDTELLVEIAISNMPRIRREVFTLYRRGYDNEKIAKALNITSKNVSMHISRARSDIRDLLYLIVFFLIFT